MLGLVLAAYPPAQFVGSPLWATRFACSLALAVCLPSIAAMISAAVGPAEQGSALGSNQSLQVGAEGVSGLAGGGLAAISTALPLPAMGALALLGAGLLGRAKARRPVELEAPTRSSRPAPRSSAPPRPS